MDWVVGPIIQSSQSSTRQAVAMKPILCTPYSSVLLYPYDFVNPEVPWNFPGSSDGQHLVSKEETPPASLCSLLLLRSDLPEAPERKDGAHYLVLQMIQIGAKMKHLSLIDWHSVCTSYIDDFFADSPNTSSSWMSLVFSHGRGERGGRSEKKRRERQTDVTCITDQNNHTKLSVLIYTQQYIYIHTYVRPSYINTSTTAVVHY